MRFILNTEKMEDMKLAFSIDDYDGDLTMVIQDFCFGLAAFFTDFAMKLDCDTERAVGLKEVCLSCIGRDIDYFLKQGFLNTDVTDGVSEE